MPTLHLMRFTILLAAGLGLGAMLSEVRAQSAELAPTPAWLEERGRMLFGMERLIGNIAPEAAAANGADIYAGGTNAGYVGFAGGPFNWDGKQRIYNMWTGEDVDVAAIRARVEQAQGAGLKVIGEMMRLWNPEVLYVQHPEWQERTAPGAAPRPASQKSEWPPVTGCWNSGFGDFYIAETAHFAEVFGLDGLSLDGFGCWTTCYCPACVESYKADTGLEIPYAAPGTEPAAGATHENPAFRRYLKWRLDRYAAFVRRWQQALRAVNPDFAMIPWSTGPGRWWQWTHAPLVEVPDYVNRIVDAPLVELFWDYPADQGNNLLPSFVTRYYRGLTGERPAFMLPYFCTQGQQAMVAPEVECAFRTLTVVTNGARPAQSSHQLRREGPLEQLKALNKLVEEREPWTKGAKSMKWAAMLISQSSRVFHGLPLQASKSGGEWIGSGTDSVDISTLPASERRLPAHMESAVGVFRAAMEEHLPLDMIIEEDLLEGGRLDEYQVLILPNAACLSDAAIERIKAFVARGGGLVALHESSLCDEFGDARRDFGLAELFGAKFGALENHTARWPYYPNPTNVHLEEHAITQDPAIAGNYRVEMNSLDYIGWTANVTAADAGEVIAERGVDPNGADRVNAGPKADLSDTAFKPQSPFLIAAQRGKGRVVYCAADLGQSYFMWPYQYQRALLANAITWAAGEKPAAVTVEAPMCVQAAYYTLEEGKQTVVHLLNELNTTADRALPEGNSSMREEIVPVGGITVRFAGDAPRRVTLQPEGKALKVERDGAGSFVRVEGLEQHAMVVAEN